MDACAAFNDLLAIGFLQKNRIAVDAPLARLLYETYSQLLQAGLNLQTIADHDDLASDTPASPSGVPVKVSGANLLAGAAQSFLAITGRRAGGSNKQAVGISNTLLGLKHSLHAAASKAGGKPPAGVLHALSLGEHSPRVGAAPVVDNNVPIVARVLMDFIVLLLSQQWVTWRKVQLVWLGMKGSSLHRILFSQVKGYKAMKLLLKETLVAEREEKRRQRQLRLAANRRLLAAGRRPMDLLENKHQAKPSVSPRQPLSARSVQDIPRRSPRTSHPKKNGRGSVTLGSADGATALASARRAIANGYVPDKLPGTPSESLLPGSQASGGSSGLHARSSPRGADSRLKVSQEGSGISMVALVPPSDKHEQPSSTVVPVSLGLPPRPSGQLAVKPAAAHERPAGSHDEGTHWATPRASKEGFVLNSEGFVSHNAVAVEEKPQASNQKTKGRSGICGRSSAVSVVPLVSAPSPSLNTQVEDIAQPPSDAAWMRELEVLAEEARTKARPYSAGALFSSVPPRLPAEEKQEGVQPSNQGHTVSNQLELMRPAALSVGRDDGDIDNGSVEEIPTAVAPKSTNKRKPGHNWAGTEPFSTNQPRLSVTGAINQMASPSVRIDGVDSVDEWQARLEIVQLKEAQAAAKKSINKYTKGEDIFGQALIPDFDIEVLLNEGMRDRALALVIFFNAASAGADAMDTAPADLVTPEVSLAIRYRIFLAFATSMEMMTPDEAVSSTLHFESNFFSFISIPMPTLLGC